jgi:hypothetical protein
LRYLADLRIAAIALLAVACGSSGGSVAAPTTPFTVWVFDEGPTTSDEGAPLPRVRVALDPPGGGERVVQTTEADGHVTFQADFARGPVQISAFSSNHTLVTMIDASPDTARARPNTFGKPPEDLAIVLPRLDSSIRQAAVEVHGSLTGKRDLANTVGLAASSVRRLGDAETKAASYAVRAPRNRPFFILGHESGPPIDKAGGIEVEQLETFRIDVPARASDGVLDIDVGSSAALPVRMVSARAEIPSGAAASFVAGTRASVTAQSAESRLLVGSFVSFSPSADARGFDLKMSVAETDISPERVVTRAAMIAPDGTTALRFELGVVPDGTVWSDFLAPTPVDDANRSISDPIPLGGFPAGADLRLEVYAAGQLVWILHGPPGGPRASTVVMPPPFGIEFPVAVQLVALSIVAEADRVPLPPHGELYRRVAISRDVTLRRR